MPFRSYLGDKFTQVQVVLITHVYLHLIKYIHILCPKTFNPPEVCYLIAILFYSTLYPDSKESFHWCYPCKAVGQNNLLLKVTQ